jgi:hypothetical protein
MSHKIIKTNNKRVDRRDIPDNWKICCSSCHHIFEDGEDRHEWRMYLPYLVGKYINGSFKITNCHECFVNTVVLWRDTMNEAIEEMPKCMKELIQ